MGMVLTRLTESIRRQSTAGLVGVVALGLVGLLAVNRMAHALERASDATVATLGLATMIVGAVSLWLLIVAGTTAWQRRSADE